MDLELKGKVALVTGGSKGIGKAIALELAREGADVAICARTREALEAAAKEIEQETGRRAVPIVADMTKTPDVERMVAEVVKAFGRVDILVNNAGQPGGLARGPLPNVTDEAMLADMDTKYMGYLRCARAVAPVMQRQGWGRIINIGGMSARQSGTYSTGARNIAVVHLSKTLADELGPSGITVNVVHPGVTRTPYLEERWAAQARQHNITPADAERRMAQQNAIRRIVDSREIACVVAFLASPKSGAITGEVIGASGGSSRAVTT